MMVGTRTQTANNRRHGFTLIEIMVVIVILAILIGLLMPALSGARTRVRQAQVRAEISQLENGIGNFKNRFGIEPPSLITLYEDPTQNNGWASNSPSTAAIESLALLRQLWPNFNQRLVRDLDGDGATNRFFTITQGECLVFFLGGMPTSETVNGVKRFSVTGFSKNPVDPFAAGGTREGPFFEFKNDRFTDLAGSVIGFPEYKDPLPSQQNPYRYFSSYDGNGYREPMQNVVSEYGGAGSVPWLAYRQGSTVNSSPFKSKSFQIISPGQDGKYGPGGPYVAGAADPLPAWDSSSISTWSNAAGSRSFTNADRDAERDNITNFSNGLLVP